MHFLFLFTGSVVNGSVNQSPLKSNSIRVPCIMLKCWGKCCTVIKISEYFNFIQIYQNFILPFGQINISNCTKLHIHAQLVPLNKTEVLFHYWGVIQCILQYMSHKSLMYLMWYSKNKQKKNTPANIFFYIFCLKVELTLTFKSLGFRIFFSVNTFLVHII